MSNPSIYADSSQTYGIPNHNYSVKICGGSDCNTYGWLYPDMEHTDGCYSSLRSHDNKNMAGNISYISIQGPNDTTVYGATGCSTSNKYYKFAGPANYSGIGNNYNVSNINSIKVDMSGLKDGCAIGVLNPAICKHITITDPDRAAATGRLCKGSNLDKPLCRELCQKYGTCDESVKAYCTLEKNKYDPYCSCVNIPADSQIPRCMDPVCSSLGYQPYNIRNQTCPNLTLNLCQQYLTTKDSNQTALDNIKQQCSIIANQSSTSSTNVSPTTGDSSSTGGYTFPTGDSSPQTTIDSSSTTTVSATHDSAVDTYMRWLILIIVIIAVFAFMVYRYRKNKNQPVQSVNRNPPT